MLRLDVNKGDRKQPVLFHISQQRMSATDSSRLSCNNYLSVSLLCICITNSLIQVLGGECTVQDKFESKRKTYVVQCRVTCPHLDIGQGFGSEVFRLGSGGQVEPGICCCSKSSWNLEGRDVLRFCALCKNPPRRNRLQIRRVIVFQTYKDQTAGSKLVVIIAENTKLVWAPVSMVRIMIRKTSETYDWSVFAELCGNFHCLW